jgi:DNA primase
MAAVFRPQFHRTGFCRAAKGGLYAWEHVRQYPEVILVEGLFDYAALWAAGFHNVTCSLGIHLNARQVRQLCEGPRTVYLTFDADDNGSGQQAAQCLSRTLRERGVTTRLVSLPEGHDPNSFIVGGGNAQEFQHLLEEARP